MKKAYYLTLTLGAFILHSCAEPQKNQEENLEESTELNQKAVEPIKEHLEKAYYPIPSPEKMFSFISDNGVPYSKDLINSIEKAIEYNHPETKSLIFGMYTADLAYAAAYKDLETAIELYKVVKRLSTELHIEEMMTEELMEEVLSHFENPDSLVIIAGDSYYESLKFLEDHQQSDKLALMSLGGWIESLYITLNAMERLEPDPKTAERIAAQKLTFGNLYTYLKAHKEGMGVAQTIAELKDIREILAALEEVKSAKMSKHEDNSTMLTTSKVLITTDQIKALQLAINDFRLKVLDDQI